MTTLISGTCSPRQTWMLRAIASAWPRSSASIPGNAPAVSTSTTTGRLKWSAIFISRCALR